MAESRRGVQRCGGTPEPPVHDNALGRLHLAEHALHAAAKHREAAALQGGCAPVAVCAHCQAAGQPRSKCHGMELCCGCTACRTGRGSASAGLWVYAMMRGGAVKHSKMSVWGKGERRGIVLRITEEHWGAGERVQARAHAPGSPWTPEAYAFPIPSARAKNFSLNLMLCPLPAALSATFASVAGGCAAAPTAAAPPLPAPPAAAAKASTGFAGAALGCAAPLRMGPPARSSATNVASASWITCREGADGGTLPNTASTHHDPASLARCRRRLRRRPLESPAQAGTPEPTRTFLPLLRMACLAFCAAAPSVLVATCGGRGGTGRAPGQAPPLAPSRPPRRPCRPPAAGWQHKNITATIRALPRPGHTDVQAW